jgi:hypothetical protein
MAGSTQTEDTMSKLALISVLATSMLAASALVAPAHAEGGVIMLVAPCLDAAAKERIKTLRMQIAHEEHMLDAERTALDHYNAKLPVAQQRVDNDKDLIGKGAASWPDNFNPQLDLNAATQAVNDLLLDIQLSQEHIVRLEASILADNMELESLLRLPACPEPVPPIGVTLPSPPVEGGHLIINVPFGDDGDLPQPPRIDRRDSFRTDATPLVTPPINPPVRNEKSVIDVFKSQPVHTELKTEPNVRPSLPTLQTKTETKTVSKVVLDNQLKTVTRTEPHAAPQLTTITHGQNVIHTNAFTRTNAINHFATPSLPMHLANPAPVLGHVAPQALPTMHTNAFHPSLAPTMPRLGGFNMARMGGMGHLARDTGPVETAEEPREQTN